jgi:hypothetical protein
MRLSKKTAVVAVGGTATVALIALIAVMADATGVAVLCVVALQTAILGLLLVIAQRQSGTVGRLAHQEKAIRALDRRVTNMALRSVTEVQAAERSIVAQIQNAGRHRDTPLEEEQRTPHREAEPDGPDF